MQKDEARMSTKFSQFILETSSNLNFLALKWQNTRKSLKHIFCKICSGDHSPKANDLAIVP